MNENVQEWAEIPITCQCSISNNELCNDSIIHATCLLHTVLVQPERKQLNSVSNPCMHKLLELSYFQQLQSVHCHILKTTMAWLFCF